ALYLHQLQVATASGGCDWAPRSAPASAGCPPGWKWSADTRHPSWADPAAVLIAIGGLALAVIIVALPPAQRNFGQREPGTSELNQAPKQPRTPDPDPEADSARRSRAERAEQLRILAEQRDAKLALLKEELLKPYRQAPPRSRRAWKGAHKMFKRDFEY